MMLEQIKSSELYKSIQKQYYLQSRLFKKPIVEMEGIKINMGNYMTELIQDCIYKNQYETAELQFIKSYLEPNDIVMEIGAGLGLLSSYCAKNLGSDRVFAYEANPSLIKQIKKNYQINNVNPHLENCIVGEKVGTEIFYLRKGFWASSTIKPKQPAQQIQVKVKSFNEEIHKINPNFLIIDIEGGEGELLKYADFYNVKKIVIELHPNVIGEEKMKFAYTQLTEAGFQEIEKEITGSNQVLFLRRNN